MKKKSVFLGLIPVFLLIMAGCSDVNGSTTTTPAEPIMIDVYSLDFIPLPAAGENPYAGPINTALYTGTIVWKDTGGAVLESTDVFVLKTQYIAELILTAKAGYTFAGVGADSFTYSNTGVSVSNEANSGVVTITFPVVLLMVTEYSLDSLVTRPAGGVSPDTDPIDEGQYTGTIAWKEINGSTGVTNDFVTETQYIAEVTLTAKEDYTFAGVAEDSFTYTGALVRNEAGSNVVAITFPPADLTLVTELDLSALVVAPVKYETPDTTAINETQYTGVIEWTGNVTAWATIDSVLRAVNFPSYSYNDRPFKPAALFKAVVTLTPKPGFTFICLEADSFTHDGASSVTFAPGTGVVTIAFPITGTAEENKLISVAGDTVPDDGSSWVSEINFPLPVTIDSYQIGAYEVTYNIWYEVYQDALQNDYTFTGNAREGVGGTVGAVPSGSSLQPATNMGWLDAVVWCNAYSESSGKTPVYKISSEVLKAASSQTVIEDIEVDPAADGFRLPTEAEWEFASRGGIPSTDPDAPWNYGCSGSSDVNMVGWHQNNSGLNTHDVGTAALPNTLGIYDMTGNVWEWLWPTTEVMGGSRSMGGAYQIVPLATDAQGDDIGFRVVCN